jgi:hypothetical protein
VRRENSNSPRGLASAVWRLMTRDELFSPFPVADRREKPTRRDLTCLGGEPVAVKVDKQTDVVSSLFLASQRSQMFSLFSDLDAKNSSVTSSPRADLMDRKSRRNFMEIQFFASTFGRMRGRGRCENFLLTRSRPTHGSISPSAVEAISIHVIGHGERKKVAKPRTKTCSQAS